MNEAASIAATNDGEVFLLTADDAETGNTKDMRFRILKYSPDTKDWTLLGGTTMTSIFANDSHISAKIAVAPDGTPFFVYADYKNDKFVKVQYFDKMCIRDSLGTHGVQRQPEFSCRRHGEIP